MRNTIEDKEKLADKIDEDDKNSISEALTEAQDWLMSNGEDAEREDLEDKMKEVQRVCDPIIAKLYQGQGGQGGEAYDDEEFEDL